MGSIPSAGPIPMPSVFTPFPQWNASLRWIGDCLCRVSSDRPGQHRDSRGPGAPLADVAACVRKFKYVPDEVVNSPQVQLFVKSVFNRFGARVSVDEDALLGVHEYQTPEMDAPKKQFHVTDNGLNRVLSLEMLSQRNYNAFV